MTKFNYPTLCLLGLFALASCGGGGGGGGNDQPDDDNAGSGGSGTGTGNGGGTGTGTDNGGGAGSDGGTSSGPRTFGQPTNNQIRPGVRVSSANGSCTSNFIYYTGPNDYYIGAAAHCFSPDTNSGIDACQTGNAPIGSAVTIENASHSGELAYSSWIAMQQNGETPGSNPCVYNDFALIRIDTRDLDKVHPAAVVFGGPTALQSGTATVGTPVVSYGQSPFHAGVQDLQEKEGTISRINGGGWSYTVTTDNPGLSGDSGSAVLQGQTGRALGVLATVGVGIGLSGAPVNNGVVNLPMALDYAQPFISGNLRVETWSDFSR